MIKRNKMCTMGISVVLLLAAISGLGSGFIIGEYMDTDKPVYAIGEPVIINITNPTQFTLYGPDIGNYLVITNLDTTDIVYTCKQHSTEVIGLDPGQSMTLEWNQMWDNCGMESGQVPTGHYQAYDSYWGESFFDIKPGTINFYTDKMVYGVGESITAYVENKMGHDLYGPVLGDKTTVALCIGEPNFQCYPVYEQCWAPPNSQPFYNGDTQNWTWDGKYDMWYVVNNVCVPDLKNGLYVPPGNYTIADYWGLAEIELQLLESFTTSNEYISIRYDLPFDTRQINLFKTPLI
jgi:hypothetical protein